MVVPFGVATASHGWLDHSRRCPHGLVAQEVSLNGVEQQVSERTAHTVLVGRIPPTEARGTCSGRTATNRGYRIRRRHELKELRPREAGRD